MDIVWITSAKYVSGYILELTFNTGEIKTFDFSKLYSKGICKKLQDIAYFKNFRLDGWTVDWNNEIGFAPEYLYEHGVLA